MWLVYEMRLVALVWYMVAMYCVGEINCLTNRVLMASRGNSRALTIPYDIAENLAENQANEPYRFSYKVQDNADNMQFRYEEKTSDGQVKGSYGYKDANNIYRMVNYYSDATGFHAKIISNEPGIIPRRDNSVNSINRELFAKQTPLAYNPANVEFIMNANQPDFSRVNTMASEYNGDWRYGNDLNAPLLAREHYAFNGGDQYAGAASQVIESRRLNSVNNLFENGKQKLSLLVLPKNSHISNSNQVVVTTPEVSNFRASPVNQKSPSAPFIVRQPASQPNQPIVHQPVQSIVHQPIQSIVHQPVQSIVHQPVQSIAHQPVQSIVHQPAQTQVQTNQQSQVQQPVIKHAIRQPVLSNRQLTQQQPQQVVRKERRRITGVRRVSKKAKDQTYFNTNPKIEILSTAPLSSTDRKEDLQSENLSLKEFSTKFPEKWHQIFSGKTFGNNFEDKSNHYAQLDAVAVRPDISLLADQSFMKQPTTKKENSVPKQSLTKKIDRVGALPRKSMQYLPPLNSETLLTSATINAAEHHSSSPRMIPRMMNPSTTPASMSTEIRIEPQTTVQPTQSSTPTTFSPPNNFSLSSELNTNLTSTQTISSTNPSTTSSSTTTTTTTTTLETMKTEKLATTMSPMNGNDESKQESKSSVTTEAPTTSTSVSIVTSTSIDQQHRKNNLKSTISPIVRK